LLADREPTGEVPRLYRPWRRAQALRQGWEGPLPSLESLNLSQ